MLFERVKPYIDLGISIFDPCAICAGFGTLLYFDISLLNQYWTMASIAIVCLSAFGSLLVYICLVTNFELFEKCRKKQGSIFSHLFCCSIGRKMREKQINEKVKNWILLVNIIIAIVITVLSQKSINESLEEEMFTYQEVQ